ncbi:MAG: NUDIX domain-containing protein [SAR202 cluster bacterium]|nr:NUDIX hydrolase [Gemmatimonadota bacterium]MQF94415.1 NUDIX domain-containing protein [SAR202 cluster bacterium]|tara:strand:+ start:7007 stop:7474 length:468 start_codon:yes stop_codon:yes gene_type:complete
MLELIEGDRVGRRGQIIVVCSAVIFDAARQRVLITRREDNGRWCLPGGRMEPGESAEEACAREVLEETGLVVRVGRLVGVYSSPHRLTTYRDGNSFQSVVLNFEAAAMEGELTLSDETTAFGYHSLDEMKGIDVMPTSMERIQDAVAALDGAVVR